MMKNQQSNEKNATQKTDLAKKLDVAGWGLFFIWIGIAFLANFGFALGLLGVGIITLGGQAAHKYFDLKIEGFWVVVGLLFVIGGIWDLFELKLPLVPILIILAGIVLLISVFWGKRLMKK
ncbi:MAG: hypothetical protein JSW07_16505 [bacterium]|nr:MAG: hypothetical protein JSW07_16505 [bacterium]